MTFVLLRSTAFVRTAKKLVKKNPALAPNLQNTLELLSIDPFDPKLKTHKLKGNLQNLWSCSAGYDLRVIFELTQHEEKQAILLLSIGSHDDVY